jgi:iodotyrosine deiodinase
MKEQNAFSEYEFRRRLADEMRERSRHFYEVMKTRRSIRAFSTDPVPDEVIENAIRTAGSAPSGANKQPWFFCVVTDRVLKTKIKVAVEAEERRNYEQRFPDEWLEDLEPLGTDFKKQYIEDAPVLIVVFKQNYRIVDGVKKKNYYVNESVGIAIGFLIAALQYAGVATLTHTPNPMKFLNELLDRPLNEVPVVLMPVGYPAEGCMVPDIIRKPLDEIIKNY